MSLDGGLVVGGPISAGDDGMKRFGLEVSCTLDDCGVFGMNWLP